MTSKTSKSYKYSVEGKKARDALNQEEQELYDLCNLAGVEISPAVLRIILDLLKLNVSPLSIVEVLKSMIHESHRREAPSGSKTSRPSSRKGEGSSARSGPTTSSRDKQGRSRQEKSSKVSGSASHRVTGKT